MSPHHARRISRYLDTVQTLPGRRLASDRLSFGAEIDPLHVRHDFVVFHVNVRSQVFNTPLRVIWNIVLGTSSHSSLVCNVRPRNFYCKFVSTHAHYMKGRWKAATFKHHNAGTTCIPIGCIIRYMCLYLLTNDNANVVTDNIAIEEFANRIVMLGDANNWQTPYSASTDAAALSIYAIPPTRSRFR